MEPITAHAAQNAKKGTRMTTKTATTTDADESVAPVNGTGSAQSGLVELRKPFPPAQIGKLPKGGVLLDFVGHGWLNQRFLDVDLHWNWEPFALDGNGLPAMDAAGGLWIRLTICGVTRIGYGQGSGADAVKIAIGDALRNAGMRFGAALDLWCKGDPDAPPPPRPRTDLDDALAELGDACAALGLNPTEVGGKFFQQHQMPARRSTPDVIRAFITKLHDDADQGKLL